MGNRRDPARYRTGPLLKSTAAFVYLDRKRSQTQEIQRLLPWSGQFEEVVLSDW
jgi:hypothetical protein